MDAYISYPEILTCMGGKTEFWQGLLEGRSGLLQANQVFPDWFEKNESHIGTISDVSPSGSRLLQILERLADFSLPHKINNCELLLGASSLGDLTGEFAGDPYGCMKHFFECRFPKLAPKFKGVVSSACSSGTDVLSLAATLVDQKKYDVIGVLAADCLEPGKLLQHFALGTQADDRARPFDSNRSGTSFGEGAGFAIVSNQRGLAKLNIEHAFKILGYGMSCDALNITAPDESGEIPSLALKRALNSAKCSALDIGYINAHASGTPLNDRVEAIAMQKSLGEFSKTIPVSGTKGAIGHLLGAVGLIEALVACWSIEAGMAPGTVGLDKLDKSLELAVVAPGKNVPITSPIAMSTTFGFGGVNSSLVLAKSYPLLS
jgi:3-oxoacyl-[acyl-carrier-protein] synthase II